MARRCSRHRPTPVGRTIVLAVSLAGACDKTPETKPPPEVPGPTGDASPGPSVEVAKGEHTIVVEVSGLRSAAGSVRAHLFDAEDGFPDAHDEAIASARTAELSEGRATLEFKGIGDGTYAASVFHDENDDGLLETNLVGMPKEGVAASNEAKPNMGPPEWEDAKFPVEGDTITQAILEYL